MKCNKIFNGWSIGRKNIGNIDIVNLIIYLHISHITTQRIKVEFPIFAVFEPKCRECFKYGLWFLCE